MALVGCLLVGCGVSEEPWFQAILGNLIQLVVFVATPIALLLVRKLLSVLEDKAHVELTVRETQLLNSWVAQAIAYAEEQAYKLAKTNSAPLASADKMTLAVEFVDNALDKSGIIGIGRDALVQLIEAQLHLTRPSPDVK